MKVRIVCDEFEGARLVEWPALPPKGTTVVLPSADGGSEFTIERTRWHLESEGAVTEVEVVLKKVPQVTADSLKIIG